MFEVCCVGSCHSLSPFSPAPLALVALQVAIASGTTPSVSIRGTDTLEELLSLDFSMHTDQRIMCVASLSDNRLVVGCQDGQLLTVAVDAYVV